MAGNDDYLAAKLEALQGGTPPRKIIARGGDREFKQMLHARRLRRETLGRAAAKRIAKVRAPIIKQLTANRESAAAVEEFRIKKRVRKPLKRIARRIPIVKPDIKSGSIITIFGPPYDVTVGWAEGPGEQFHGVHVSDGSFQVFADGGDGYTSVVSGVGKWFSPIKDGALRVASYTPYDWEYSVQAGFVTAHCDAYIGWWIWNATDETEVYSSLDTIFSYGVSWLEGHQSEGNDFFQDQPIVQLEAGKVYKIVVYCEVQADDSFSYSFAAGSIAAKVGFFLFELFI